MQRVAILYISKIKDIDLYGLLKDVGMSNFKKCAVCCVMALSDSSYINKARSYAKSKIENGEETYQKYVVKNSSVEKAGVKLRLSILNQKNVFMKTIVGELVPSYCSAFIKTTMRQVLGPQILLQYFLKEGSEIEVKEIPYASLISMGNMQPPKKRRTRRKVATTPVRRKPKVQIDEPDYNISLPTVPTSDAPSFGPSFKTETGLEEEEDKKNTEDTSTSDDDLLSMLEAMMS